MEFAVVILLVIAVGIVLFSLGVVKSPLTSKKSSVQLTSSYDNPFEKNTQYVNPFNEYKNPFDLLE